MSKESILLAIPADVLMRAALSLDAAHEEVRLLQMQLKVCIVERDRLLAEAARQQQVRRAAYVRRKGRRGE